MPHQDPAPVLEVQLLDPRLRDWGLPDYQSDMAAAIDLHACLDAAVTLEAGAAPLLISSGLAIHIGDPGIAALVLPRSGLGHKKGLVLGNLVGLIDPDYTGPILVSAWNRNPPGGPAVTIEPGERFAQMMFVPVIRPRFTVVDAFSARSERGAGGFGSTGAKGAGTAKPPA
ncbi:dUTP diphosphatase [Paeniroseomonas aquatica]|uniref:dUTP diphosphatase n=1 Tax=Paeniroseomonas aquatica TaxID=373043 RepID=UPI00361EC425